MNHSLLYWPYSHLLRPILFGFDPEGVHNAFTNIGHLLGKSPFTRGLTRSIFTYNHPILTQTVAGLTFKNTVGLAAGFDYDA